VLQLTSQNSKTNVSSSTADVGGSDCSAHVSSRPTSNAEHLSANDRLIKADHKSESVFFIVASL